MDIASLAEDTKNTKKEEQPLYSHQFLACRAEGLAKAGAFLVFLSLFVPFVPLW